MVSCGVPETRQLSESQGSAEAVELVHAKRFKVSKENGTTSLLVNGGASSDLAYEYILINENIKQYRQLPGKHVIKVPVREMVVTSTSHVALLELLGATEYLVGFPNTNYVSSTHARSRIDQGLVKDIGSADGINFESLVELNPELVVHYISGPDRGELELLEQSNIPVVINLDFLEETPLGKAEWIKFMGILVGKEELADSIFQSIKTSYLDLMTRTDSVPDLPKVFSGILYGDTWFAPGAKSFVAKFIEDAGGDYTWKEQQTAGSVELSFEAVLERNSGSDFWIGAGGFTSKASLKSADSRYGYFQAFRNDRVYNYHGKIGATGGFEYLESGGARPDIVLADFIKILHPELVRSHQPHFFKKLE